VVCSNEQLGKLRLNMNFRYGLPKSEKRAAELGRCLRNCFEAVLSLVAEPEDHGQLLRPLMQSQWAQKLMKSSADLDKNTLRDVVGQAVCTTYQVCILYRCLLQKCVKYAFGDSMWMEAASLKSAFGKLAVLRKAREAAEKAAAAERALATAVVGASQAEGAPQDNETESAEPTIRLVIEEEEARLDDIVACDEDCQPGDGADTEEDLVQKLEEAGEKEFIAQVVNPELEHV
jgi:hypothetical protein